MNDQNLQVGVLALIKSAILQRPQELCVNFNFANMFQLSQQHQITGMLYYGMKKCKVEICEEFQRLFFEETVQKLMVSETQLAEAEAIFKCFMQNGIDFMPLKGINLKHFYPEPGMREMTDVDILIREEQYEKIRPLMRTLGYEEIAESDHEHIWNKTPVMHIELHKRLIPSYNKDYYAYYGDGWRFAQPTVDDSNQYKLSDEDEFIYLFTHFAKHYRDAGIGLKHVVDLWVYLLHHEQLDFNYIEAELKKLGLDVFHHNVRKLLSVWFEGAKTDEVTELMSSVIFDSGAYGTYEAHLASDMMKRSKSAGSVKKARILKIFQTIFLPYRHMCKKYPVLKKWAVLLPLFWVIRWGDALLFKHQSIKKQAKDFQATTSATVNTYQQHLNAVGLDFNFGE